MFEIKNGSGGRGYMDEGGEATCEIVYLVAGECVYKVVEVRHAREGDGVVVHVCRLCCVCRLCLCLCACV